MMIKHDNNYQSWGSVEKRVRQVASIEGFLEAGEGETFLPFGNGRSYGDSCHNDTGTLLATQNGAAIHHFDSETGILDADAGVLLYDVLEHVMPQGYFLQVTPGTSYVTLGGAIANDVHGKNHHRRGTFGHSVLSFTLLRSDKPDLIECSPRKNKRYFQATIGGMGLTGIITRVRLQLMKVSSADVHQKTMRFNHIDEYFEHSEAFDVDHEYSVAWIDQLASGSSFGRGVLMAGNHAKRDESEFALPAEAKLSVPLTPPVNLINRWSLSAFNFAYFHKFKSGLAENIAPWQSYFYPLDAINGWNKLYGPKGLYQHQSVYPKDDARKTTIALLQCAKDFGHGSFLTVLKCFGPQMSNGLLSFPRDGYTLTLDFSNQGPRTLELLAALDDIVMSAGGAVNPYKDQRMSASVFAQSFPKWAELEALRDPKLNSDFWRRTALKIGGSDD